MLEGDIDQDHIPAHIAKPGGIIIINRRNRRGYLELFSSSSWGTPSPFFPVHSLWLSIKTSFIQSRLRSFTRKIFKFEQPRKRLLKNIIWKGEVTSNKGNAYFLSENNLTILLESALITSEHVQTNLEDTFSKIIQHFHAIIFAGDNLENHQKSALQRARFHYHLPLLLQSTYAHQVNVQQQSGLHSHLRHQFVHDSIWSSKSLGPRTNSQKEKNPHKSSQSFSYSTSLSLSQALSIVLLLVHHKSIQSKWPLSTSIHLPTHTRHKLSLAITMHAFSTIHSREHYKIHVSCHLRWRTTSPSKHTTNHHENQHIWNARLNAISSLAPWKNEPKHSSYQGIHHRLVPTKRGLFLDCSTQGKYSQIFLKIRKSSKSIEKP